MSVFIPPNIPCGAEDGETADAVEFDFGMDRRQFVEILGAGLLFVASLETAQAQARGGRGGGGRLATRLHIGRDGKITVMTGKIEMGQGARTELTQAAAEELRVPPESVQMIMADTGLTPDDGITAGSRTTPSTVPAVRQAAAAARELFMRTAANKWGVEIAALKLENGQVTHPPSGRSMTYADLAASGEAEKLLQERPPGDVQVTPVSQWRVMGRSLPKVNRQALVTGAHTYPSDLRRPGMLYGKVLRPPSFGAHLLSVDLEPARKLEGVVAVQDGSFVGVAAPNTWLAEQALKAVEATARWEPSPHPSSREIYDYLRQRAQGGVPPNPFEDEAAQAAHRHKATYHVAYVQHAPMETRTALAEWKDGKLTVWTGTQAPFGYHAELSRVFRLSNENVRVVVPDFGGGFGGKHTAEAAIEAARLAQAAGKPVLIQWTREEEFTWAYFRPAAVIDVEATLDAEGRLTTWHFVNINSGAAAVDTPYRINKARSRHVGSNSPLRQGSYRTLAATANNFAREAFMDEMAARAGRDPLEFRLAHLENERIRAVLLEATKRFNWQERFRQKIPNTGVGLACGTEKNSVVAACVEIGVDPTLQTITVKRVCEVFECGAIVNPDNLLAQVQSCILMGLGPALREEMQFLNGKMRNANFSKYPVPRFADVPEMEIHLLNRPDLPSAGGGETPIIAIAPAIANAVYHATGRRVRAMPIRLAEAQPA